LDCNILADAIASPSQFAMFDLKQASANLATAQSELLAVKKAASDIQRTPFAQHALPPLSYSSMPIPQWNPTLTLIAQAGTIPLIVSSVGQQQWAGRPGNRVRYGLYGLSVKLDPSIPDLSINYELTSGYTNEVVAGADGRFIVVHPVNQTAPGNLVSYVIKLRIWLTGKLKPFFSVRYKAYYFNWGATEEFRDGEYAAVPRPVAGGCINCSEAQLAAALTGSYIEAVQIWIVPIDIPVRGRNRLANYLSLPTAPLRGDSLRESTSEITHTNARRSAQSWFATCEDGHPFWSGRYEGLEIDAKQDAIGHDTNVHGDGAKHAVVLASSLPPDPAR